MYYTTNTNKLWNITPGTYNKNDNGHNYDFIVGTFNYLTYLMS